MKYCEKCGEQLEDDAVFCSRCGARCDGGYQQPNYQQNNYNNNFDPNNFGPNQQNNYNNPEANKSIRGIGMGVLFGALLGLIGLIIVLVAGDSKAKKGCLITFGINIAINILLTFLLAGQMANNPGAVPTLILLMKLF